MESVVVAGSTNRALAERIAAGLTVPLAEPRIERFADGELEVALHAPVRGKRVLLVQSLTAPVGESLLELQLLADAAWRVGASRITAVLPYLAYARQDRRTRPDEALGGAVVARALSCARHSEAIGVDVHAASVEAWFGCPVEHLTAAPLLAETAREWLTRDGVVVSPDLGGAKRAGVFARLLEVPLAVLHKTRRSGSSVSVHAVLGDVRGRRALIVDDMISTAGTVEAAVLALRSAGAERIAVAATHGLFVGPAVERLRASRLEHVWVTDTVAADRATCELVSVAPLFVDAIKGSQP